MKTKDRKIRITNIPKEEVIYQVREKINHPVIGYFITGGLLIFLKFKLWVVIILLILVYNLFLSKSRVVFELRKSFLLAYNDKEFASIIYYAEIVNYQVKVLDNLWIKIIILTGDENISEFILSDKKVVSKLNKLVGEKQVGK